MHEVDLDYVKARPLIMPQSRYLTLILVGCGGTGSWLAPAIVRIGRLVRDRNNTEVNIIFCDPDQVEEKNVYRQNFCEAEIGRNKAETLALRYGMAWGMTIQALPKKFDDFHSHSSGYPVVIIGCVDGAEGRKEISKCAAWWLDCGNERNSGQVLLGGGDCKRAFGLPGFCGWLPMPHVQHPELVVGNASVMDNPLEQRLSCAEMALLDSQGMAINQRMAAEAADYLVRMLITRDLRKFATYIDLESGSCRSRYITEETIRAYMEKK